MRSNVKKVGSGQFLMCCWTRFNDKLLSPLGQKQLLHPTTKQSFRARLCFVLLFLKFQTIRVNSKLLELQKKSEIQKPSPEVHSRAPFVHSDPHAHIFPCFDVLLVNRGPCSSALDACLLPLLTDHEAFSAVSLDKIFTRAEVQLYGPISLLGKMT